MCSVIHFGRNSDNDRNFNILKGRITLHKEEVQSTFDNVIEIIVNSCLKLFKGHKIEVSPMHLQLSPS